MPGRAVGAPRQEQVQAMKDNCKEGSMTEFIGYLLIVDDKEAIHRLLRTAVTANAYAGAEATSDYEALATLAVSRAALIALDSLNANEVKVTDQLRDKTQIPVILFAVNEQEKAKQWRPNAHADGDFVEPRAAGEETARLPNTTQGANVHIFRVRDLTIDRTRRMVTLGKEEIHLTPTEYELICLLTAQAGTVVTHEQLLHELWGAINPHTVHLLRVNISNLRRKLDAGPSGPRYITTEPGIGYRLRADL
jgi:two-component system, OmpR family, KDP operon response regulator KdpE